MAKVVVAPALGRLGPLTAVASALVTANSTAAIEAMPLGVPALVVALPNNLSPFVDAGAMAGAGTAADVAPALRALLYDGEMRGRLAAAQGAFMRRYRIEADGRAARRAADAILCSGEDLNRVHAFITGGAGFIGSHLAEALLAAGHQVYGARQSVDRRDGEHRAPERAIRASAT